MTDRKSWVIPLGDAVALLAFASGGEASHELFYPNSLLLSILHAALPFFMAWFPVAFLVGALSRPQPSQSKEFVKRSLAAWFIAAPLGILVRGLLIQRDAIPLSFLVVTYVAGSVLLIGWRLIFVVLKSRAASIPSART